MMITEIQLKPSLTLAVLLSLTHLGAMVCVVFLIIPFVIKLTLISLCGASLCYLLSRNALLLSGKAIVKIQQEKDGNWRLQQGNDKFLAAKLRGDSVVARHFVLLNFITGRWFVRSVLLFNDTMAADEFRKLRVWLLNS